MFNVKRIGSTVEITQIPREVSIDVFKKIAAQTEANECLICFSKDTDSYEVIISHDNDNMAGAVAWLVFEVAGGDTKKERKTKNTNSISVLKGSHIETLNYYSCGMDLFERTHVISLSADSSFMNECSIKTTQNRQT
ncbi:hypothetical protein FNH73_21470 [Salmonella enterica subsp. salamae]|nr:hypothetical protein [Salmonella enterica subsp. salamae]